MMVLVLARRLSLVAVLGGLTATTGACYVDPAQDRAITPGVQQTGDDGLGLNGGNRDAAMCRTSLSRGCFDGFVIPEKEFTVEGKQFFNADELAGSFATLVKVSDQGKEMVLGKDYTLALTTPLDNDSFLSGFDYDLSGPVRKTGKVRANGNFSINDLIEDTYDLRLSRSIKFTVTETIAVPHAAQGAGTGTGSGSGEVSGSGSSPVAAEPAAQTIVKNYCATLYADEVVEIRRSQRAYDPFSDFHMHVTDQECAATGGSTDVTVRP